ncbi:MAG TPA: type II toxin-antitoxin system death-on-curing family toxin [Vicinamibacterales bacterium]|jgi:death-on-curing protein|nr:type II toxin-antitoxin system death-on-curing family toxin [Vicinamibacterales bacterium]
MRYLTLSEVIDLHSAVIAQTGGASGVRDIGLLESAIAQPQATFGEFDLHPSLVDKAAALGFALIANHPFLDGNKRAGHAAMEVFLVLNGHELAAAVDEQERMMLSVAAGEADRVALAAWLLAYVRRVETDARNASESR